jgi:pyridoxine kinase
VKIVDMASLKKAVQVLHEKYQIPHIIITSVNLAAPDHPLSHLSVVGSTMTSDGKARCFKIVFPAINCYFSGTGDMFAALIVVRMREAVYHTDGLREARSWRSDDSVKPLDLPLARAAEKVLASMHEILTKTIEGMQDWADKTKVAVRSVEGQDLEKQRHLLKSRATELRLVRNLSSIISPTAQFKARQF